MLISSLYVRLHIEVSCKLHANSADDSPKRGTVWIVGSFVPSKNLVPTVAGEEVLSKRCRKISRWNWSPSQANMDELHDVHLKVPLTIQKTICHMSP